MIENISIEYANAYSEVLEILEHMSREDYNKVPKDMIEVFKNYSNKDYKFNYNFKKDFTEQNLSKRAKLILAILFRDYWATPKQKEKIIAKQNYDRIQIEKAKQEKYNADDIFKNRVNMHNNLNIEENECTAIVEVKEKSFLRKIFEKIKNLFNRK